MYNALGAHRMRAKRGRRQDKKESVIVSFLFGSQEWLDAYQQAINSSPAYKRAAATWEGDFYFVVVPEMMYDEPFIYYLDLWHGDCRSCALVEEESAYKPAYRLETSDTNWRAVIEKRLDPLQGMMTRRIKLEGDMAKIMRAVPAAKELVNCAASVPTAFPPVR
jgi:putative sterol carrier protein